MLRIKIITCFSICMMLISLFVFDDNNDKDYTVIIKSFTENGSYVEYPQVSGLKDKKKQACINTILKEQVYVGAKDSSYETFVDFSNPEYVYNFKIGVGFISNDVASFLYSFNAYGFFDPDVKVMQNNDRSYGVTIDMQTGKKIELPEFMVVDERLINSTDGSNLDTDYNSIVRGDYHKFKDLFWVYTTEEEKDYFHSYTPQEAMNRLENTKEETIWYIDENKNIVFFNLDDYMEIPYNELAEIIYPQYLESLSKK
ncbi:hypothetical protein ADH76_11430 [Enterocloster clostridioformis]|nr:hypothetical protein A4V08_23180 [Lachnoclostridium sp. YL32]NDO29480.1 hypothetical protein [Enterocloster clostridioformis]OXE69018.1 hypothetical protein ADH76_11430 [Enterocloster clostridioformis]QQR02835.1 hypothetical protein I5Q83_11630 [Enterocloster clostridioformis]